MRWVRYMFEGKPRYGIVEGDEIAEVDGDPFTGYQRGRRRQPLAAVKLEVPVIPRTFYCAGFNYLAHARAVAQRLGTELKIPEKPDIGYRANNALIADGEPVIIPADATGKVQYEGELVVVIGRQAKHLAPAEALDCVFGYTIGNDVSERSWQRSDRTLWRAKNTDSFKPMGPWIETEVDLDALETVVRVNGATTTQFRTNDMLFGVATYLSAMSRYLTLYPGDVVWMGTDGTSPDLKPGDVVAIEITGIGTLTNPFIAETPR